MSIRCLFVYFISLLPLYSHGSYLWNGLTAGQAYQVSMTGGQSFRSKGVEQLFIYNTSFSRATTCFDLPSKTNIEFGGVKGKFNNTRMVGDSGYPSTTNLSQYNLIYIGVSEDVKLIDYYNIYSSMGTGLYLKEKRTDRINSIYQIGLKLALGYNWQHFSIEGYIRHFTAIQIFTSEKSQNYYGLTVNYNF